MIRELNDINLINGFLNEFNQKIGSLNDPFKKYVGFEINNKIVGFLNYSLIYERIEIDYIYTKPEFRNRSVASKLLDYLISLGIKCKCINITLEVKETNIEATTI